MKTISEHFSELLLEKLITLGGKVYPKFGNIVIMAGGGGSGKGFVQDMLLGLEGRTFDVDTLKELTLKTKKIRDNVLRDKGVDIHKLKLSNPDDVSYLHNLIGRELRLPSKRQEALATSILSSDPSRKPNLIFDVTLKNTSKLEEISKYVSELGYDKTNVHLVWVINDVNVALDQNKGRGRVVPQDVILDAHSGVARTMSDLLKSSTNITKYLNGDIWFVFNKRGVDSTILQGSIKNPKRNFTIKDANMVLLKKSGSKINRSKLDFRVINTIMDYIPQEVQDLEFR